MLKRTFFSCSSGIMLTECLFTLVISGILFLCINKAYPYLINKLTYSYQQYRLDIFLRGRLAVIETQLRRTGYCNGKCRLISSSSGIMLHSPLTISHYPHQPINSCVIFVYDMNNNGKWDSPLSKESDYFGYRLKEGRLEQIHGSSDCRSSGWQQFFDSNEIRVTAFILKFISKPHPTNSLSLCYLSLTLKFELKKYPKVKSEYQTLIYLRNLSCL